MKKKFRIPPSYTFTVGCSNPSRIVSLAPFVSPCSSPLNQHRVFRSTSANLSSSLSSSFESDIDDDEDEDEIYHTPPSSVDSGVDSYEMNPFEKLAKQQCLQVKFLIRIKDIFFFVFHLKRILNNFVL